MCESYSIGATVLSVHMCKTPLFMPVQHGLLLERILQATKRQSLVLCAIQYSSSTRVQLKAPYPT